MIAALVLAQAVGAGVGMPTVTSFEKASDAMVYFGKAIPTPDPSDGGKFAICFESPNGAPVLTLFLEYRGTSATDGRLVDSRLDRTRAPEHDRVFKSYKLRCVSSPKVNERMLSRPK
ncbi:hypothetical protein BWI17_00110 [Betaproteobacteria bacterium GR16-43]|nr:hypothetical protein BWI17_00110 [Betaproteobacteria bacterium GR16-43]